MTEKLYYTDSHLKTFEATVVSCEPSGERFEAVLDRTAFFPEGGGQLADTGRLGDALVLDVQERAGIIRHIVDIELQSGDKVTGSLAWEKRFSRMQQHTGEHIVSGLIHQHFGYQNVGFHLGEKVCTLDLNGPLTKEELERIEYEANVAVAQNSEVQVGFPTKEELSHMHYRSKIELDGQVRIVTIPGVDVCACCAPHVCRTGEIGLIKFTQSQNYKGGVRLTMVCGFRALEDYRAKEGSVKTIMQCLSVKEELVAEAVVRLKETESSLNQQLDSLQKKLLQMKVEKIQEDKVCVCLFEDEMRGNGIRDLMNLVLDKGAKICAVFVGTESAGYRYVIGSKVVDVRALCKKVNEHFSGRGGGKPEMVQGSLAAKQEELEQFIIGASEEGYYNAAKTE